MDSFGLQNFGGLAALPRGCQLDQDAIAADALRLVHGNDVTSTSDAAFGVKTGVHTRVRETSGAQGKASKSTCTSGVRPPQWTRSRGPP